MNLGRDMERIGGMGGCTMVGNRRFRVLKLKRCKGSLQHLFAQEDQDLAPPVEESSTRKGTHTGNKGKMIQHERGCRAVILKRSQKTQSKDTVVQHCSETRRVEGGKSPSFQERERTMGTDTQEKRRFELPWKESSKCYVPILLRFSSDVELVQRSDPEPTGSLHSLSDGKPAQSIVQGK